MQERDRPKMPNHPRLTLTTPAIALPRAPYFSACGPGKLELPYHLNMGILKSLLPPKMNGSS
jgi:hypothetical protein